MVAGEQVHWQMSFLQVYDCIYRKSIQYVNDNFHRKVKLNMFGTYVRSGMELNSFGIQPLKLLFAMFLFFLKRLLDIKQVRIEVKL